MVKRLIGRTFAELDEHIKTLPYTVVNVEDKPMIQVTWNDKKELYAPEEISAMILEEMKNIAEAKLGTEVCSAVITVQFCLKRIRSRGKYLFRKRALVASNEQSSK